MKIVLHVGCGVPNPKSLHAAFQSSEWKEIRFDIDPLVKPDIVGTMTKMPEVADRSVDAVWSSQNLEHLYPHEVPMALSEFRRVLRSNGIALISLPDLQEVARLIADDKLEDVAGLSPAGPIAPLDLVYGWRTALAKGHMFMAHHCGFTAKTLLGSLTNAGFAYVIVQRDRPRFNLWALAFMTKPNDAESLAAQTAMLPGAPTLAPASTRAV